MSGPLLWMRRARREAGATATTVGVLAVGIAANVVVFQTVDRLVLDPVPLPDAADILVVGSELPAISRPLRYFEPLSGPELADLRDRVRLLDAPLPFDLNSVRMRGDDAPVRLFGAFVWADPLPLLGVEPELGRSFAADEVAGGARVALLGHAAWVRDFAADPAVVGRAYALDGQPHVVVGVLPPWATLYGVDVWVPHPDRLEDLPRDRRQFNLLARRPAGASLEAVNADLAAVAAFVARERGADSDAYGGWRLQATSYARNGAFVYADEAVLTMAASLLVLLLICVNLGNLALVRGVARRGGVATRLALGASRGRVASDAAGEALALAAVGGVAGLVLAVGGFEVLGRTIPAVLQPAGPPLGLDGAGVAFGGAATLVAGAVLALAAAAAHVGTRGRQVLRSRAAAGASRRLRSVQRALVAAQVALGLALASGAGAVGAALVRVLLQAPGFAVDEIVSMRLSLPAEAYAGNAVPAFFSSLVEGVGAVPGVRRASMATQVAPNTLFSAEVEVASVHAGSGGPSRLFHTVVGPGYFDAMGIPLVAGRPPDARDREGAPAAMVVNEAAAARLFPGRSALGEAVRVRATGFDSGWGVVVGVSRDVRNQGQGAPPAPEVFTVHGQAGDRYRQMFLIVRGSVDPAGLVPAVRAEVARLDPAQPVYAVGTARAALSGQLAPRRVAAVLLAALSALAVGLAGLGLHGVLSYAVATRRGELAVRASLGADPSALRRMLLADVARTVSVGLGAGVLLTVWLGWALRASVAAGVGWNGAVVAGAALVLVAASVGAAARPASAVARTDPAQALRAET